MKLDNKKNTFRIWLQKFFATLLFVPAVIVIWFTRLFNDPVLGLEKGHYLIIACVLYIAVWVYHFLLKPYFVFFTDNGNKIIFRYYPISALNRKKHSIEIPKDTFLRYKTETYFLGKERLFLYQRLKNKIAKYPPVNLSALGKNDIIRLKRALDQYV
jgi:hypothetical protein